LRTLVGIATAGNRRLVSFMAKLHCATWAEKLLIPAFIWFFMMLYPFNWVNRKGPVSGAAGAAFWWSAALWRKRAALRRCAVR
jgi:hypothetical protein